MTCITQMKFSQQMLMVMRRTNLHSNSVTNFFTSYIHWNIKFFTSCFCQCGFQFFLSVDATEEFRIITRNPSAEFGRTGGGVMNMVSKSGSNLFHGSAYEFLENRDLNANDFFSNRAGSDRAPLVFNEFGATLGGRLRRDKTFFFVNWEEFKQSTQARAFQTVPTAAQRLGDFSQTFNSANQLIVIYDPLSTRPDPTSAGKYVRTAFPNNVLPADRIFAGSRTVGNFYPAANTQGVALTGANNFLGQASAPLNKKAYGVKIDEYLTPANRVAGRVSWDTTFRANPPFFGLYDNSTSPKYFPRVSVALSYTGTISPTLLVEARTGLNRYAPNSTFRSLGFDLTSIGLPASVQRQIQYQIMPQFSMTDVSTIGGNQGDYPKAPANTYTVAGSMTKIHGSHLLKFGAERRVYQLNSTQGGPIIQFAFSRGFTQGPDPTVAASRAGYGFASFLLGDPSSGAAARWIPTTYQGTNFGTFLEDDWKVSPKLTLNLGMRWEFEGALTDRYNAISNFDPSLQYTAGGIGMVGGVVYPGSNGLSRGNRANEWKDFEPRLGFAYQLNTKTVIRGGYGIYHLPGTGMFITIGQTGFSLSTPLVVSADGGLTPYETLRNPFTTGIPLPPGSSGGPLTGLGAAVAGNLRTLKRGYSQQFNFNIQRELPGKWLVEIGYAGNHGVSLPATRTYDYLPTSALSFGSKLLDQVPNPYAPIVSTGNLSLSTVTRATLLDTYPQFTSASGLDSWANSIYHSLTVRVERRFAGGFSLLASYAFSKLIDDNLGNGSNNGFADSGSNAVQNWDNLHPERAISADNLPHHLVLTGSWLLPIGKSGSALYRRVAGGWQLNSILTLQSGDVLGVTAPVPTFGGNRPNVVGDPTLADPTIDKWFNTGAFANIAPYTLGNAPRNLPQTRSDRLFNWNFSVLKSIPVTERVRMQLRGEFFNFTNTTTFGIPGTTLNSATFGVVSSLGPSAAPRVIQVGAKLLF